MGESRSEFEQPGAPAAEVGPRIKRASGMGRAEAWFVHLANLAVAVTGVIYALFRWWIGPVDEFSLSHPWQPTWQHLHVVTAPLLVFAMGLVWRGHVWRLLRSSLGRRRRSGWALLTAAVPMILSGYLLQVSTEAFWRGLWTWTHVSTSSVWLLAYAGHQLTRRSR